MKTKLDLRMGMSSLSFEVWEVYALIRILVVALRHNEDFLGEGDEILYVLTLAEIIEERMEKLPIKFDVLSLEFAYIKLETT